MEIRNRKPLDWSRVLLAFLIAMFLFSFGLLIGFLGSKVIEGASIGILESTKNEIANLETINMLEQRFPCSDTTLDAATNRLAYITDLIDAMETQRGKDNNEVLELKKLYSIIETRHMLLLQQRNEQCGEKYEIFLYFYSNSDECKDITSKTAFVLSYLRNKNEQVRVYSYDIDLNSDVINILQSNYEVSACSTIVYNDKKYEGIDNAKQAEELLE